MKKIALVLFSFFLLTSFSVDSSKKCEEFNFVGKWSGKDSNGKKGSLIFTEDGYATMIEGGNVIGGKEFTINGRKGTMRYSVNQKTDPMELDLIVEDIESGLTQRMYLIVKVIDKDNIQVAIGEKRPTSFENGNSLKLKRE